MDFWHRAMTDLGQAGPDKGRAASTCCSVRAKMRQRTRATGSCRSPRTTSSRGIRVLDPGVASLAAVQEGFRVYPYAERASPPAQESRAAGGKTWPQVQPRGMAFWSCVHSFCRKVSIGARYHSPPFESFWLRNRESYRRLALSEACSIGLVMWISTAGGGFSPFPRGCRSRSARNRPLDDAEHPRCAPSASRARHLVLSRRTTRRPRRARDRQPPGLWSL
jgi:hypothetical protein